MADLFSPGCGLVLQRHIHAVLQERLKEMQSLETHDFYCACNYLCLNNKNTLAQNCCTQIIECKKSGFPVGAKQEKRKRNAHCVLLCLIVDHGLGVFAVGCSFYGASNDSRS